MEMPLAKDERSTLPGPMPDHEDAVKAEVEQVSAKIDKAFRKLAKKMRERADKAKAKADGTRKPERRAVLLRRCELYADAATHIEGRFSGGEG
ncbi:hypothetical protein ME121_3864 [Methylobacterium sp. ME121]|jgi:ElaB/YqjD/DUF883 family membrane-anchored ribosome-binding protein|nr:hypothetical protein ME121_3864 [Methylobacterium sp. ME121]